MDENETAEQTEGPKLFIPGQEDGYEGVSPPGEEQPEQPEDKVRHVKTAFVVFIMDDGSAAADADLTREYVVEREAVWALDFWPACMRVAKDVEMMQTVQNVVQNVVNAQIQVGNQMRALMESQSENERLKKIIEAKGGFKGKGGAPR